MPGVLVVGSGADWEAKALAALEGQRQIVVVRRCVDVDDLLAVASTGQADVALVGVEATGLDADAVDTLRHLGVEPVVIVSQGVQVDAATERLGRIGVTSILRHDQIDQIANAVMSAARPDPDGATATVTADGGSRVVTVWGPTGAPGRSTLAVNVAVTLARRGRKTLLIDADPYGGSIAQLMGVLDETAGLLVANRSPASAIRQIDDFLAVVTGLPRADRWSEVRRGVLGQLINRWQGTVVVDAGFCVEDSGDDFGRPGRNQMTIDALDEADLVVAVGSADPVGLARLARGVVDLRSRGLVPHVVVNRMRPSLGWDFADVAQMLRGLVGECPIDVLPEDRSTFDRAGIDGRAVVEIAPESPVARAVSALVDQWDPDTVSSGRSTSRRAGRSRSR